MCCIHCIVLLGVVVPNLNWIGLIAFILFTESITFLKSCLILQCLFSAVLHKAFLKATAKQRETGDRDRETEKQKSVVEVFLPWRRNVRYFVRVYCAKSERVGDRQTDSQTDRAVNKHMAHVSYILHCNELRCEISDCITFHRSVTLVLCSVLHAVVWCCVFTSSGPDLFRLLGRVCVVSSCCPKFDGVY